MSASYSLLSQLPQPCLLMAALMRAGRSAAILLHNVGNEGVMSPSMQPRQRRSGYPVISVQLLHQLALSEWQQSQGYSLLVSLAHHCWIKDNRLDKV